MKDLTHALTIEGKSIFSELDRTFTRHPEFVVFAAQNPHHEGGGRKGLPASFVNRFTVVYIDTFSEEDLYKICTEAFPNNDEAVTRNLTRCVDRVSKHLQNDSRLDSHGGPWEINLRDALRWLQMLQAPVRAIPADRPSRYEGVLLSQRFRTPEDRRIISNIVGQFFDKSAQNDAYFANRDSKSVEIGLGVLPCDRVIRPFQGRQQEDQLISLSIAESMTLCIDKGWPVLLVGPSGSGKTSLIVRLAELAGVDVVQLCLNSEMDTVDLLGGFEQVDLQRALGAFTGRLRDHIHLTIAEVMSSSRSIDSALLELLQILEGSPAAEDVLPELSLLAQRGTDSTFSAFLDECRHLIDCSKPHSGGQFEWVDGLLVKALKQGKWLILDNANLCSPSVLDRLNSLFEPNGFLAINEHRNNDGSAQIVKPHSNFRVFMIMDPHYGELSRAMRNRSVELFMPAVSTETCMLPASLDPAVEASVSRFALLERIEWHTIDQVLWSNMLSMFFEHLTFSDMCDLRRWQSQVLTGMSAVPPDLVDFLKRSVMIYEHLCRSGVTLKAIQETYKSLSHEGSGEYDVGNLQVSEEYC